GPFEFEVTELLTARNELVVDLEMTNPNAGLWVELEVRCTAYLRNLRFDPGHILAGELIGAADRPLDLYVLVNGKNVAYSTLEAAPEGRAFQFSLGEIPKIRHVKVELVNGAVAWYTAHMIRD